VAVDGARITELRRRVQSDPSSIAFAQLGEELRRAGANEEAIDVCQSGLARHPGYLSARVTLGRALLELGQLDDAHVELSVVVENAPDNLAAIRGMAEIHQRRGELADALVYYRRALELARHDPELEETVERIQNEVAPPMASETDLAVEALFDFDRLVEQLGAETPPGVAALDALPPESAAPPLPNGVTIEAAGDDKFARLEADLREHDRVAAEREFTAAADAEALAELENWLDHLRSSPR
jgi:tetratricopeptide (TPR) repeat protein